MLALQVEHSDAHTLQFRHLRNVSDMAPIAAEAAWAAAEDAALPPLSPGMRVELTTSKEWSNGLQGKIRDFDPTLGKYYVWLPDEPTGMEASLEKPLLMLVRRAHLKQ